MEGTAGSAGSYVEITVSETTPDLYIYCEAHSGMGGALTILDDPMGGGHEDVGMGGGHEDVGMEGDGMGDGSPSPKDTFIMVEGTDSNAGTVYLYTPDDQMSVTLTGIGDMATAIVNDDLSDAIDMEMATEMAIEDVMMDFMGDDHDPHTEIA